MRTHLFSQPILAIAIAFAMTMTAAPHADAQGTQTAMLAYGRSAGGGLPRYRIWGGSAWGAEASANGIGSDPQWVVLRGSPLTNQFALATLDADQDIDVQIWNGASWGSVFSATSDCASTTRRVFDLAYEHVSGHMLLVYREYGTSQVRYRTHNGLTWSSELSYIMTAGNVRWLQLVPDSDSDQMIVIAVSDSDTVHKAARWNGSSFTNQVDLNGIDEPGTRREHADAVYEGVSGQVLLCHNQDTNSPAYRTMNGGSWSGSMSAPSVGGQTQWTRLTSDRLSDEVIMATLDQSQDVNVTVWNGSAWGTPLQVESNAGYTDRRSMDVMYEPSGNEALVVYEDGTTTLKHRTWNGSTWSGELSGPTGGTAPLWNPQTVAGAGQVFVTYGDENRQINAAAWNGSSFGSTTLIATSSGSKEYENFMVAVANGTPKLITWQETQP